jgi:hypothetical protein
MNVIDPKTIVDLDSAQELIGTLQQKLFACELLLEDMARAAEIASMTNQLHLVDSFVETSNEYLKDRLILIEEELPPMEIRIVEHKELQSEST